MADDVVDQALPRGVVENLAGIDLRALIQRVPQLKADKSVEIKPGEPRK